MGRGRVPLSVQAAQAAGELEAALRREQVSGIVRTLAHRVYVLTEQTDMARKQMVNMGNYCEVTPRVQKEVRETLRDLQLRRKTDVLIPDTGMSEAAL